MNRKFWQFLALELIILLTFSCTEHVTENKPATIGNKLDSTPQILRGLSWSRQFAVDNAPTGHNYNWQAIFISRDPEGAFEINPTGLFRFTPAQGDSDQTFGFRVVLSDGSGIVDNYDFAVSVTRDVPLILAIERTHSTFQGISEYVSISKIQGSQSLGRIECSIVFDSIALQFQSVEMGRGIAAGGCNWDRIEYSLEALPAGSPDSLYLLRLTAIADDPLIDGGPSCTFLPNDAEIFVIKMKVSGDSYYNCAFLPLRFVWTGCQQNAAYSPSGDTVFLPAEVYDYGWDGNLGNHAFRLSGFDCDSSYGYSLGGECPKFIQDCAPLTEIRNLVQWNGGVETACVDSIDIPFGLCPWDKIFCLEFDDFCREREMYRTIFEYVLQGDSIIKGMSQGCIRQLDANFDGRPLSIGDLVYIARFKFGQGIPPEEMHPYHSSASFSLDNDILTVNSSVSIGGIDITMSADSASSVTNLTSLTMDQAFREGKVHVLIQFVPYATPPYLPAGLNELIRIDDGATIDKIEVADYSGNMLLALYNKK
ncbi:MAG: hypothetical protein WBP29_06125 [Candidatus Zixiibacteriota bacterium]